MSIEIKNPNGVVLRTVDAAAPDLLEALKRIYDMPTDCPCEVSDEVISAYSQARAAIAKAEGKEEV